MGKNQSNLSSTGFDYVVAVSQDSINGTLEEYLYSGLPEVILCYVYDSNNNPTAIDFATFVKGANNTDPFCIPGRTPSTDPRVQNLNNAGFAFAIKAKLGLPPGVLPANLPPIVALKPGQSNVTYTLMFAEFVATELLFGPRGSVIWFNEAQAPGTPWTFTGTVDLNLQGTSFTNLPPATQQRLRDLGDPAIFSVQQLYYDLNSSDLEQGFQFNNLPSNSALNAFMTANFINTYWKALGGSEVLGYGAQVNPGNAVAGGVWVSALNFFTPDAVGNEGAPLTLNYLCATDSDPLPDTTQAGFGWNWLEPGEVSQYDGVAAFNRNTLAVYYHAQLYDYALSNCYSPAGHVRVWLSGPLDSDVNYQWGLSGGQTPTLNFPASGPTVLTYAYSSPTISDQAGLDGDLGKLEMSSSFTFSVSFQDNTVVIVQHLVIWCYIRFWATSASGNVVDKQITDTYTFAVNDTGAIVVSGPSSVTVDNSQSPGVNGFLNFFTGINQLIGDVAQWAQGCAATNLTDVPASVVRSFVFPGGATFSFTDVSFSDNQDLVSHITYVDPAARKLETP